MQDEEAIRRTLVRYCHLCDDGRFDEFAGLFTEDATFTVMGTTHRGRDEIRGFMQAAQAPERRGKHLISEPLIEVDGDEARCGTDYAFVSRQGDALVVLSTGRYVDRLVREGDGWSFASREIVFLD